MFSSSDEFRCGLCHLSCKNFLIFLEHKIQHFDSESLIECPFCCDQKQLYKSSLFDHIHEKHLIKLKDHCKTDMDEINTCDVIPTLASDVKEPSYSSMMHIDVGDADKLFVEKSSEAAAHNYITSDGMDIFKNNNGQIQNASSNSDEKQLVSHLTHFSDDITTMTNLNESDKDSETDLKDNVISREIGQKVDSHSCICGANLLANRPDLSSDNIFELPSCHTLGNPAEEKSLTHTAAPLVSQTTASLGTLVTDMILSPPAQNQVDSSFTLKGTSSEKKDLQELGNTTRILLPLPLDLSSTHSLCQAINLSLRSASNQLSEIKICKSSFVMTNCKAASQTSLEEKSQNEGKVKEGIDINSVPKLADKKCDQTLHDTLPVVSSKPCDESMVQNRVLNSFASEEDSESLSHDFYFLLGNMDIKGSSLTYQRTEFRCFHCSFSTAWRPSLVKHMKQVHKDTLEIHSILDIRNLDPLKDNSTTEEDKKWKVIKMSQYLLGNQKLKPQKHRVRKLERQDVPGKYHCPLCHKVFGRLRYMRRHQSTHRTERTHLCDNCGKSFKTKAILVAHRRSHKSRSYHCPQCPFTSSSSPAIHIHRQLHPNGSVICEVCGNAYIDKSTLNKHMKVHDISRPFPCTHPGCTWRFKTDVMRKAHVRSHTTVGKFSCSYCGYVFRQKHHLQRHIAKLHHEQQTKNVATTSHQILSPHVLNLTHSIQASAFITQNLSVGQAMLLDSAGQHDLLKNPIRIQDPLMPPCGLVAHGEMLSPSTNTVCPISDTSFSSGYADSEHAMIEVIGDKHNRGSELGLEDGKIMNHGIETSNLANLEYITETGEVVHLLSAGHTYVARDQFGNLVHYKLPEAHEDSQQIYLIDVNNTAVIADTSEQTLANIDG